MGKHWAEGREEEGVEEKQAKNRHNLSKSESPLKHYGLLILYSCNVIIQLANNNALYSMWLISIVEIYSTIY